ncbi:MAG: GntR family transcriptional regulator [Clostridia bacterium]|nr:GntR family transcriptional regulator [Clostridia bacterium]
MDFVFDNNIPIYIQLVEQLKTYIVSGALAAGERLPSVRELAMMTKVNPNTVQKALGELENLGLIYTERTNGKFVSCDSEKIYALRLEYAKNISAEYLAGMKKLGFSAEQAVIYLEDLGGEDFDTSGM